MNKIFLLVILIGLPSLSYTIAMGGGDTSWALMLLPFSFLALTFFFKSVYEKLARSTVFHLFVLQAGFRYFILPVLLSAGQVVKVGETSAYVDIAIIVMILELFSIFLALWVYSSRRTVVDNSREIYPLKNIWFLVLILIVMFFYIYATGSLNKVSLIWSLDDYIERYVTGDDTVGGTTLGVILFTPFKILLALLAISLIYSSKSLGGTAKTCMYLVVILISSLFIVGTSRFSMVLFVLPLLVLVKHLVDDKSYKVVLVFTAIVIAVILVVATLSKFSHRDGDLSAGGIISANSLNAYFAGVGNVATGFDAYEKKKGYESALYFVNDTFQNIPILSKLTDDMYKLTATYNEEVYNHRKYADQIVPLNISGLFHFGVVGVLVYAPLFILIALYMERWAGRVKFIGYRFLLTYLSISLSLVFMLNIGSFYSTIAGALLFVYVPLFSVNSFNRLKLKLVG